MRRRVDFEVQWRWRHWRWPRRLGGMTDTKYGWTYRGYSIGPLLVMWAEPAALSAGIKTEAGHE